MKALHERGLTTALNDHPAAGVHKHEDLYVDMSGALGHDPANGAPIQFDPTSPAFMHAYLNVLHRKLDEQGCDFWWIDWQQGTHSRVSFDPLWVLNHFQFTHDKLQKSASSLPLIFSRYAGPGSHRYLVGFSGDSHATWASLRFQPDALEVLIVVGKDGDFTIIEVGRDDEESDAARCERQRFIQIKYYQADGRLETIATGKAWTFRFISMVQTPAPIRVFIDGNLSTEVGLHIEKLPCLPGITVQLPNIPEASSTIRVELGENPHMAILDPTPLLGDLIEGFQISNHAKDRIWDVVSGAQPAIVNVGGLLSLKLDDLILGALIELIMSSSEKDPILE
jgi:hypothetical protein